MSNGKGSKPRPYSKYQNYLNNWDEINWSEDMVVCCECGQPRKKEDLKNMDYKYDGEHRWTCKKCNWN